jgi:hypothetical protein
MNWDSPLPTKLYLVAAGAVLVAGWVAAHRRQLPTLSAPPPMTANALPDGRQDGAASAPPELAAAVADGGMRDAVASPALPMAAGGWFGASGAAALSRAARAPSALSPLKQTMPPRPTSGRAAFSGRRVIVDIVKPGVPEPAVSPSR